MIGSIVKLKRKYIAVDEWTIRGYESLIGLVVDRWEDQDYKVVWQNGYKYCGNGEKTNTSWEYEYALEVVS